MQSAAALGTVEGNGEAGWQGTEPGALTCVVLGGSGYLSSALTGCSGFPGQAPWLPWPFLYLCAFSFFTVLPCCVHVKQHCTGL